MDKTFLKTVPQTQDKINWLRVERVRMIYECIPVDIAGTLLICLSASIVLWDVISHWIIIVWFLATVFIEFIFYLMGRVVKKDGFSQNKARVWENMFALILFFQGLISEGSLALFLFPETSVPHQAFIACLVGGVMAGAISFYTVSMKIVFAAIISMMPLLIARFFIEGSKIQVVLGVTLLIYVWIMYLFAKRTNLVTLNFLSSYYDLSMSKETLEDEVNKATASLRESLEEEKRLKKEKEMMIKDLHDGVGGVMTNINLIAEVAQRSPSTHTMQRHLSEISHFAKEGISDIRNFMQSLDNHDISLQSFYAELREIGNSMLEPHNMEFNIESLIAKSYASHILTSSLFYLNILRIYKEVLMNIIKHAKATNVTAIFEVRDEKMTISVKDNGIGFTMDMRNGSGLNNIKSRTKEMGGELRITSDMGLCVTFEIPLSKTSPIHQI
ncbi:MAG: ATP-binding protein [Thermodesulfovibrionales bacterium]|nr:ATP-binding protein [Thermodesulfovibrionales bacterium]